jgi:hypothetical protein
MTTRSIRLRLEDEEAKTIDALSELSDGEDFLARAVMKVVYLVQSSHLVGDVDLDRLKALRSKAAPYRDASDFSSEGDFLRRA